MEAIDILKQCTSNVELKIIHLPNIQLDRKLYQEVAKKLELIGGKWNRSKNGFIFQEDPTELLKDLAENKVRNIQKEFQFFETPQPVAEQVLSIACFDGSSKILEPSAGRGMLILEYNKYFPNGSVDCYELLDLNRKYLKSNVPTANIIGEDFLTDNRENIYDCIIANPPFNKFQYIEHIYKMYSILKSGGSLVTVAPISWQLNSRKKEIEFKNWLTEVGAEIISLEKNSFKSSGTVIDTLIISIEKR